MSNTKPMEKNAETRRRAAKMGISAVEYKEAGEEDALQRLLATAPDAPGDDPAVPPDLAEGQWYWVHFRDGWMPACRCEDAAGGWSNLDTWEDWDGEVDDQILIPHPENLGPGDPGETHAPGDSAMVGERDRPIWSDLVCWFFGDFRTLCQDLRERPGDWIVSSHWVSHRDHNTRLWTANGPSFLDFYEDARRLPLVWRPLVWRALQEGQRRKLSATLRAAG